MNDNLVGSHIAYINVYLSHDFISVDRSRDVNMFE